MAARSHWTSGVVYLSAVISLSSILICIFYEPIWRYGYQIYEFLADRGRIEGFIASFGWAAPIVFMAGQILQVIFAPIPGEATGFIGGYLFGGFLGFIYSSLALGFGSWINFYIGRLLGERYVRRMVSPSKFARFDTLVRRQGVIIVFILYIFPGFPKDWLSLFLGITTLPVKIFIIVAAVGRMPGTLLLSLQGELLFDKNYVLLIILIAFSALVVGWTYFYRERLYRWVERSNHEKTN